MAINQKLFEAIKKNNNVITTSEVNELGFSRMMLSKYVEEGILVRCRQGVYTFPEETQDDMYTLMLSSPKIIFSHETAAFLNGLSDRTPFIHSITVPSNSSIPKTISGKCNCFYIKKELHEMGQIKKKNTFGNIVRCYDAERTVCDVLRSRSRIDEESIIATIKNYVASKNNDFNKLASYSEKLHVNELLNRYLEVLL